MQEKDQNVFFFKYTLITPKGKNNSLQTTVINTVQQCVAADLKKVTVG